MPYKKDIPVRRFHPKNPKKYMGNAQNIIARSKLELKLMKWVDEHPQIVAWASEEIAIPYLNPIDKAWHRYFPDLVVVIEKQGTFKKYLIEVKPKKFCVPPKPPKRQTKGFLTEVKMYAMNSAKWEAAKKYADQNKMQFMLMTEEDIND